MELVLTAFILTLLFIHNSANCPKPKYIDPFHLYSPKCCNTSLDVLNPFPGGNYPERPEFLQLTDFLQRKRKGLKAVWNASLTHLKGFKIEYDFNGKICTILDLSEFLKNKSIGDHVFEFSIYPLKKNKEYSVHLYSLPESGDNYLTAKGDTFVCREWTTRVAYKLEGDTLIVDFNQGPSKCKIEKYDVALHDANSTILMSAIINSSQTTSRLTHEFHNMCSRSYYATVQIFDEFWNTEGKCICRDNYGRCGVDCFRSKSNNFEVHGLSCTTPSSANVTTVTMDFAPESESTFKLTIFLAIIGAMIGLLLLVVSFYCFKRTIQEKRGLLFYTEDHSYHCEAIDQFISFMDNRKCKLEVAARLVKGSDPSRLNLEIQESQFIILVYSKALHKRIQAWKRNQDYINFLNEDNSALLTASLLGDLKASNKLIICKFPQVPSSSVSSEFPSVKCYTLTKDLNLLIQQIHGRGMDHELSILIKSNKLHHNSLTKAINSAVDFEENSSFWFEDKYTCPKRMETFNEMPDYGENLSEGCENSIYSIPVSYILEQINECNDSPV